MFFKFGMIWKNMLGMSDNPNYCQSHDNKRVNDLN